MTQGTYGRTFSALSEPIGPLSSWENRLRNRLAAHGSTESALIWKATTTPAGRSIYRLAPSTLHTNGPACTGSLWPTPRTPTGGPETAERKKALGRKNSGGGDLAATVIASLWSTPRATDGEKGGPNMSFGAGGQPLPAQAYWSTPTSLAPAKNGNNEAGNSAGLVAIRHQALGTTPNGPSAPTEKRGGLNPEFVCWLMGYPAAWLFAAPRSKPAPRHKSTGTAA